MTCTIIMCRHKSWPAGNSPIVVDVTSPGYLPADGWIYLSEPVLVEFVLLKGSNIAELKQLAIDMRAAQQKLMATMREIGAATLRLKELSNDA